MKHFYISIGVNLALILAIILVRPFLPPVVPLLYGKPVGEMQLVNSIWLIIPSLVSIVISLINFLLNKYFVKDNFHKKILSYTSLFINILVAITVVKIIFLVGSF